MHGEDQDLWQGLRILIVDDEEEFASTLASRLELRDMLVRCAFGGKEGIKALTEELPDVLLLDMRMPGCSGLEVLRWLRKNKNHCQAACQTVPVILVSGHADQQDIQQAETLGIQGTVAKPVQFDELLTAIAHSLGRMEQSGYSKKGEQGYGENTATS